MAEKYFLFSMSRRKTGVDNVFRMLNLVFKEAQHLNRTPVIGKFTMSPSHNFGNSRHGLSFEDYLDLSGGITVQFNQGHPRPIASHLNWIKEEELNLKNYTSDKIYTLADDEIVTEKMNRNYDVFIRRDPTFKYVSTCKEYKHQNYLIDFPYSDKVNKLTDGVLGVLGLTREHAVAAQHYFLGKINDVESHVNIGDGTQRGGIPLNKVYYACMCVHPSENETPGNKDLRLRHRRHK